MRWLQCEEATVLWIMVVPSLHGCMVLNMFLLLPEGLRMPVPRPVPTPSHGKLNSNMLEMSSCVVGDLWLSSACRSCEEIKVRMCESVCNGCGSG